MARSNADRQRRYRERRAADPAWVEAQRQKRKAWYAKTRDARNAYAREYAKAKLPQIRASVARYRREKWAHVAVSMAKARARKRGVDFSIRPQDVQLPNVCPVLGTAILPGSEDRGLWPSLDRLDNNKGYVPGNVRVISWRANRLKGDATLAELRALVAYMETGENHAS